MAATTAAGPRAPRRSGARSWRRRSGRCGRRSPTRRSRSPTRRGSSPAPPRRAGRRRSPGSRRAPTRDDDDDDDDCEAPRCLRCAAALLAEHCRAGPFAATFAGAGGAAALERLRARTDLERAVGDDLAAAAAALAATLEFAALEARCDAALEAKDAAAAPGARGGARAGRRGARAGGRGGVLTRGGTSPDLLRAARLGEFEATFAAEKVGVADLVEARDAGDLGDLLADCGLKAGERARLKRELAKLRPVLQARAREAEAGFVSRPRGGRVASSLAQSNHLARRALRFSNPPCEIQSGRYSCGPARRVRSYSRRWRRIHDPPPRLGSALEQRGSRRAAESRGVAWGCLPSRRGVPYHKRGRPAAKKRWRCALSLFRCCPRSRRRRARGSRSASARSGTPTRRRWSS